MRILAVTNMYPSPDAPWEGTFVRQQVEGLGRIGVEVEVLFAERRRDGMRVYGKLSRRLKENIDRISPSLVHVMYGGVMAEIVTRVVRDRPVIVSLCGSDLMGEVFSPLLRRIVADLGVLASKRAARRAAGVIVKAANLRDALPRNVSPRKVRIIPNGVDQQRFRPLRREECRAQLGWKEKTFHVLFPSDRSDMVKRPRLAQAALESLKAQQVRTELHYLSGVAHEQVPLWLNAANVLLITSSHEGSPNILKEALACNIPVVSLAVGDARERLAGVAGCYIAEPQPVSIAAKLLLVRAGPGRVNGRQVLTELTLERTALRIKEFYEDVLALAVRQKNLREFNRREVSEAF